MWYYLCAVFVISRDVVWLTRQFNVISSFNIWKNWNFTSTKFAGVVDSPPPEMSCNAIAPTETINFIDPLESSNFLYIFIFTQAQATLSFYEHERAFFWNLLTLHVVGQRCLRRALNLLIFVNHQLHLTPFLKRFYICLQLKKWEGNFPVKNIQFCPSSVLWIMKICENVLHNCNFNWPNNRQTW